MPDPSRMFDLHHSSQQCRTLNPLSEARDQTCILMDTRQICFHWVMTQTPVLVFNWHYSRRWIKQDPRIFFTEVEQNILNIHENTNRPQKAKQNWKIQPRNGRIRLSDFRPYTATVMKTVWCWKNNRYIDQWNRIENTEINPCTYGQLI